MKAKMTVLFFGFLILFPFGGVRGQEVSVEMEIPAKGVAGGKIPVRVIIDKGDYTDFGRFRQTLPNGFDVKPVELSHADLTLKKGEANFIWLKLPEDKVITLSYDLIPDPGLRGVFQTGGSFSYIINQERKEVQVPERSIQILPPSGEEASAAVAATVPPPVAAPSAGKVPQGPPGPFAYRGKPVQTPDGKAWIIRLIINRGPLEKLGRLEEIIPTGYLPENINGKGAIFSYRGGEVKYIWMTFPTDTVFEVSYKLVPQEGVSPAQAPSLTGYFSYMKDDESERVPVQELAEVIPAEGDQATLYTLAVTGAVAPEKEMPAVAEETPAEAVPPAGTQSQKEQEPVPPPPVAASSENKPGQPTEIVQHAPQQGEGIYFRVQILATSRPAEAEDYFRIHNIPGKIYKEYDNGLYKYTTGSFTSYRDARAFVSRLKETTDIANAFVTAYEGDRRISVREALDRTGQKWFK